MRKLDTLVADFPDTYKLTGQDEVTKNSVFKRYSLMYNKNGERR